MSCRMENGRRHRGEIVILSYFDRNQIQKRDLDDSSTSAQISSEHEQRHEEIGRLPGHGNGLVVMPKNHHLS